MQPDLASPAGIAATPPARRAIIVGAGIGGLTTAVALRRAGFEVAVYERAPELRPVGAGLTVQPNAILALRRLGVAARIEAIGASLRAGGLYRADGRPLSTLPPAVAATLLAEVGAPIIGIHRATLHDVLLDAVGRERVHLGHTCKGYRLVGDQVDVTFDGGETLRADLLVGADGIHSAVRAQLIGDGEPTYAGYTCWRGVTSDRCGLPDDFGGELWARANGRSVRFGCCCIDGGRLYWFLVADAPAGEKDDYGTRPGTRPGTLPSQLKDKLAAMFAGTSSLAKTSREWPIPALIRATPDDAIFRADIADRTPQTRWGEGVVTLVGDAAHAMTPNLGQGACQAIEDALVVGLELGVGAATPPTRPIADALRAYEAKRQPRANAMVLAARRLGRIAHWKSPLAAWMRTRLFASLPQRTIRKQLIKGWQLPY